MFYSHQCITIHCPCKLHISSTFAACRPPLVLHLGQILICYCILFLSPLLVSSLSYLLYHSLVRFLLICWHWALAPWSMLSHHVTPNRNCEFVVIDVFVFGFSCFWAVVNSVDISWYVSTGWRCGLSGSSSLTFRFVRRLGKFEAVICPVTKLYVLEFSAYLTYFSIPPILLL